MILLLNGAFGIGKTSVARILVARLPDAVLYDPEPIGIALQRITRVADFQDLRLWRRLTILALRVVRLFRTNVVVPMAFSNADYLQEIREGIARFDSRQLHFCLVAPMDVVQQRIEGRNPPDAEWQLRRAAECCAVHHDEIFATQIDTADRDVHAVADEILRLAVTQ